MILYNPIMTRSQCQKLTDDLTQALTQTMVLQEGDSIPLNLNPFKELFYSLYILNVLQVFSLVIIYLSIICSIDQTIENPADEPQSTMQSARGLVTEEIDYFVEMNDLS